MNRKLRCPGISKLEMFVAAPLFLPGTAKVKFGYSLTHAAIALHKFAEKHTAMLGVIIVSIMVGHTTGMVSWLVCREKTLTRQILINPILLWERHRAQKVTTASGLLVLTVR